MLSPEFFKQLKKAGKPIHEIAWECGLSPNRVYRITSGIDRPDKDDPRVKALCKHLGLSIEEAFIS